MLFTPVDDISEERWRTGPGTNLKTWRIPQCPLLMECSSAVLEQIRREVEAGRNLVRAERETGGVLFGIHEPGRICILACKALPCEHAMGPGMLNGKPAASCSASTNPAASASLPARHSNASMPWAPGLSCRRKM